MSPDPPHDPAYRPCVGIALFNREGLVFIGRRVGIDDGPGSHAWQMPQGGIDAGEDALAAARRELLEETGVAGARLLGASERWLNYDLPADLVRPSWRGRYRGQAQRWFAFRHDGPDSEIDLAPPGHKPEFSHWRWESLERTPDLVIPFKRGVYETVAKLFAGFAVGD